jgi:cytochrome c1
MKKLLIPLAVVLSLSVASSQAADAKAIWEKDCAKCHAPDGSGNTTMGKKSGVKDYTSAKVQAELKDADMLKAIKEGVKVDGKVKMKAFEVTDEENKALVAYIRSMKKQ